MDEVDAPFLGRATVVIESCNTVQSRLPVKRIRPVAAQIFEELAFHAQRRAGARNHLRPSSLSQAKMQVILCSLGNERRKAPSYRDHKWPMLLVSQRTSGQALRGVIVLHRLLGEHRRWCREGESNPQDPKVGGF